MSGVRARCAFARQDLAYRARHVPRIERPGRKRVGAEIEGALLVLQLGGSAADDQPRTRLSRPELSEEQPAVERRHAEVEHDRVGRISIDGAQRCLSVGREARLAATALELAPQRVGYCRVVGDHEHPVPNP